MRSLGFSHGVLYRVMDKFSSELFQVLAQAGGDLIEVCWNNLAESERLMSVVPYIEKYSRVSLHLPVDFRYTDDERTRSVLERAKDFCVAANAALVVIHPDLIDDPAVLYRYPMAYGIENMDCRKKKFRSVEDLRSLFIEHDTWSMVLDVNHCYSNDPSMKLADDFISEFSSRIRQIHVSGYAGYHDPLFVTEQKIILDACKKLDAPMVIESVLTSPEDAKKEFDYIYSYLNASIG